MSASRPDAVAKRARIIDAARTLFAEKGYEGTTIRLLARQSNSVVGSITHVVGPKPVIAGEVYEAVAGELVRRLRLAVAPVPLVRSAGWMIDACHQWLTKDTRRLVLIDELDWAIRREKGTITTPWTLA